MPLIGYCIFFKKYIFWSLKYIVMSNIFRIKRDLAKALARFPRTNDEDNFDEMWPLINDANDLAGNKDEKEKREKIVDNSFAHMQKIFNNELVSVQGFQNVAKLPSGGKYVIFSDHHLTHSGNRHDYFRSFGNSKLYTYLLLSYFIKGYTLIENGDIEDLLVLEPDLNNSKQIGKLNPAKADDLNTLNQLRRKRRLDAMHKIMDTFKHDEISPYKFIAESFHKQKRYIRLTGNHDFDLHDDAFGNILRDAFYPGLVINDFALIDSKAATRNYQAEFMITHGHQLDESCHPVFADKAGEVFSECLSWAYEGADRVWRWEDEARGWATGVSNFNNSLVTGNGMSSNIPVWSNAFDAWGRLENGRLDCSKTKKIIAKEEDVRGFFEEAQGHQIAWEYLNGNNDYDKVCRVLSRLEFFKYRHMKEEHIRSKWVETFPAVATRPKLVLGHSHEVRFNPVHHQIQMKNMLPEITKDLFPYYFNAGSAGRFENLIWALEIDDNVPTLVSWSFKNGPNGTDVERRKYIASGVSSENVLRGVVEMDF